MLRFFVASILLCFFSTVWNSKSVAVADSELITCSGIVPMRYRNDKISITDFGGVGDGKTLNTKAFREAIYRIEHLRRAGGTLLYIPPGVYLTEAFNLTSHMTLYLARGAVIKATQVKLVVQFNAIITDFTVTSPVVQCTGRDTGATRALNLGHVLCHYPVRSKRSHSRSALGSFAKALMKEAIPEVH